jgi:hypothetical protein
MNFKTVVLLVTDFAAHNTLFILSDRALIVTEKKLLAVSLTLLNLSIVRLISAELDCYKWTMHIDA